MWRFCNDKLEGCLFSNGKVGMTGLHGRGTFHTDIEDLELEHGNSINWIDWPGPFMAKHVFGVRCTTRLDLPKRFKLFRRFDVTGVSGTGWVVEGILFTSGVIVLTWITGTYQTMTTHDNIDSVRGIHGHLGHTLVDWIDEMPPMQVELPLQPYAAVATG